jgi:hypothetical protein
MPRRAYSLDDLAVIFLTRKSRRNAEELASLLERSPTGIDWIWRSFTCGGGIGPRPSRRLTEQVEAVIARFGGAAFQSCQSVAEALAFVYPPEQGAA